MNNEQVPVLLRMSPLLFFQRAAGLRRFICQVKHLLRTLSGRLVHIVGSV